MTSSYVPASSTGSSVLPMLTGTSPSGTIPSGGNNAGIPGGTSGRTTPTPTATGTGTATTTGSACNRYPLQQQQQQDQSFQTAQPTQQQQQQLKQPTDASQTQQQPSIFSSGKSADDQLKGTSPTTTTATIAGSGQKTHLMVVGATGTTGKAVVEALKTKYPDKYRILAGIHQSTPDDAAFLDSVDIYRRIDADNLETLDFTDVHYLFLIPSNAENRVDQVRHYTEAAKRAGVQYIFLLSTLIPTNADSLFSRQFSQMETFVAQSQIPFTFLRTTFFQQNFYTHMDEINRLDQISLPIGLGKCAPLHIRDVARAAAAIFGNVAEHLGKCYNLVGPDVLDGPGIAEAASRALERRIHYVDVQPKEFIEMYERQGVPKWMAKGFCEILQIVSTDELSNLDTKSFFSQLTSAWPISVEVFFRENRDLFSGYATATTTTSKAPPPPSLPPRAAGEGGGSVQRNFERELHHLQDLMHQLVVYQKELLVSKREELRLFEDKFARLLEMQKQYDVSTSSGPAGRYTTSGSGSRFAPPMVGDRYRYEIESDDRSRHLYQQQSSRYRYQPASSSTYTAEPGRETTGTTTPSSSSRPPPPRYPYDDYPRQERGERRYRDEGQDRSEFSRRGNIMPLSSSGEASSAFARRSEQQGDDGYYGYPASSSRDPGPREREREGGKREYNRRYDSRYTRR